MNRKIENSLINFLNRSATKEELDLLQEWVKDPENLPYFKNYLKLNLEIAMAFHTPNANDIEKNVLNEIRREKRKVRTLRIRRTLQYAAGFIVLAVSVWFIRSYFSSGTSEILIIPDESVVLEKSDGSLEILNKAKENTEVMLYNGTSAGIQKGNRIVYTPHPSVKDTRLNKLIVPYGKKFELELADGTEIFLNAGSTIKYPVNFQPDTSRIVHITGEAFFKVTKDSLRPFIVKSDQMAVEVLGTSFNVLAYPEDSEVATILVEGKVKMISETSGKSIILEPGEKGVGNMMSDEMRKEKVNTRIYTSWLDGRLVFRHLEFNSILKKLERHYNVTFVNQNTELARESFNASFSSEESITAILEYFRKTHHIDYEILENQIVIK